jgi:hypothetical protein
MARTFLDPFLDMIFEVPRRAYSSHVFMGGPSQLRALSFSFVLRRRSALDELGLAGDRDS